MNFESTENLRGIIKAIEFFLGVIFLIFFIVMKIKINKLLKEARSKFQKEYLKELENFKAQYGMDIDEFQEKYGMNFQGEYRIDTPQKYKYERELKKLKEKIRRRRNIRN